MTYREKLQHDHPELINPKYYGGCSGCPHEYYDAPNISEPCDQIVSDKIAPNAGIRR